MNPTAVVTRLRWVTPGGSAGHGLRDGLYSTHVGKKYAMAVSGIVLLLFVLVHMLGNLKLYLGAGAMDSYSSWLRTAGEPVLPRATLMWAVGMVLVAAVVVHIHAAYVLTLVNRRARPLTGDPYHNVVESFQRWPVAIAYVVANLALATHLYHGAWSLFQSMGWVFREHRA